MTCAFSTCSLCSTRNILLRTSTCFFQRQLHYKNVTFRRSRAGLRRPLSTKTSTTPLMCQKVDIDEKRTVSVSRPSSSLWESIRDAPLKPGIYIFRDEQARLLYVGKSKALRNRVRSYFAHSPSNSTGTQPAAGLSKRIELMTRRARSVEFIVTKSEAAALALEASLIREHTPPYNILLKDDARYPSVCITFSEKYPRILISRNRRQELLDEKRSRNVVKGGEADRIYGPFVDSNALRRLVWAVQRAFPLRQRATPLHRDRPCINYEIGRCPGICQNLISDEEYMENVKRAEMVFTGRVKQAVSYLEANMKKAAEELDFEGASEWRDRLMALQSCFEEDEAQEHSFISQGAETSAMWGQEKSVSRDIAAVSKCIETGTSLVILFQVRDGRVVNKLAFNVGAGSKRNVQKDSADTAADILVALEQHYLGSRDALEIPEQVLITEDIDQEDKETLTTFLSQKRGKSVRVSTVKPKSKNWSATIALVDMVQRNADFESSRASEKLRALERDLASLKDLLAPYAENVGGKVERLRRIECYDVSHISGTSPVASQAVFINGSPEQSLYKKYYLKDPKSSEPGAPNDYHSLKEALSQRFNSRVQGKSAENPDLIVIDGGKGQLSAALVALEELELRIPVVSIAKRVEEIFVPKRSVAINMREDGSVEMTDGVRLLCRARDEAHRWAIQAHRRLRGRAVMRSSLDQVPGLGENKRNMLLKYFKGNIETIAGASEDQLRQVDGIGREMASRIHQHYKKLQEHANMAR